MALHMTLKIEYFLHNKSLRLVYVVYVEQTIEEQKMKFDFQGQIIAIYTGLLIYPTLLQHSQKQYQTIKAQNRKTFVLKVCSIRQASHQFFKWRPQIPISSQIYSTRAAKTTQSFKNTIPNKFEYDALLLKSYDIVSLYLLT